MKHLSSRKFIVAMTALVCGLFIGLWTKDAAIVTAYAGLASACVVSFNAAHAVADSKWGQGKESS